jgi:hypothetical protein
MSPKRVVFHDFLPVPGPVGSAAMSEYLVEAYQHRAGAREIGAASARARQAADELAREGAAVRYLRSIFVPEDELCFHLFESPSPQAVRAALARAELEYERIVEATRPEPGAR